MIGTQRAQLKHDIRLTKRRAKPELRHAVPLTKARTDVALSLN
jgi:hypothetical protein